MYINVGIDKQLVYIIYNDVLGGYLEVNVHYRKEEQHISKLGTRVLLTKVIIWLFAKSLPFLIILLKKKLMEPFTRL